MIFLIWSVHIKISNNVYGIPLLITAISLKKLASRIAPPRIFISLNIIFDFHYVIGISTHL